MHQDSRVSMHVFPFFSVSSSVCPCFEALHKLFVDFISILDVNVVNLEEEIKVSREDKVRGKII